MSDKSEREKKTEIRISDIRLERKDAHQLLSATVDGETIWFRFPLDVPVRPRAEPFLPFCFFDAMDHGCPIVVEPGFPISRHILQNFSTLMDIYHSWNYNLKKVELVAESGDLEEPGEEVFCCYSGGIDSTYSFAKHRGEITSLLSLQGWDHGHTEQTWNDGIRIRTAFAESHGKKLIAVATNGRQFLEDRKLSWSPLQGSILGTMAITLNAKKLFIPSSFTYDNLFPWGTHPLIDVLWSTENTQIVHDGLEARRTEKTEYIARDQDLVDQLQVCWQSPNSNCGKCSKCVRTSIVLDALNIESKSLPSFKSTGDIKTLKFRTRSMMPFIEDLILFMHRIGHKEHEKTLKKYRHSFIIADSTHAIGKAILGNRARNLYNKLFPNPYFEKREGLIPHSSILDD
ncbi:hypothetical protein [Emcibacter sp.]|uniref:hypothetical protein n=1 Tax=Emcibacter sp. TaxID=1979954 RepID=UPI003A8D7DF9